MKLAIMQPYFFPYIGYYQLMNAVEEFIIYDNIKFTKKGWINRNRILVEGQDKYITLPLKNDSDYLNINERYLADNWNMQRKKLMNRISQSYKKAPFFKTVFPLIETIILFEEKNLFNFLFNAIKRTKEYLDINTVLSISSQIPLNHELKAEEKVIGICKAKKASVYINPVGGLDLYSKSNFKNNNICMQFLKLAQINYNQFHYPFVPSLSVIDVMMFNDKERIKSFLAAYELI